MTGEYVDIGLLINSLQVNQADLCFLFFPIVTSFLSLFKLYPIPLGF